jgi:hypothetical protein
MHKAISWGPACGQKHRAGAVFLPQAPLTTFFGAYISELLQLCNADVKKMYNE